MELGVACVPSDAVSMSGATAATIGTPGRRHQAAFASRRASSSGLTSLGKSQATTLMSVFLVAGSSWLRTGCPIQPFLLLPVCTNRWVRPAALALWTTRPAWPPSLLLQSWIHMPVPVGSQRSTGLAAGLRLALCCLPLWASWALGLAFGPAAGLVRVGDGCARCVAGASVAERVAATGRSGVGWVAAPR